MALQLPKIDLADAKTRVVIILGGLVGFIAVIYIGVHFLANNASTTGGSKVATAPGSLQSVPGGQLTPEYYRALMQANEQAAKQAKMSGGSAVPTLVNEATNPAGLEQPATANCTIVCPSADNVNVENDINDLVKAGKLSANDARGLLDAAEQNVAISDFSARLNDLVKQGRLSPEQARKLLDDYKQQHANFLLQESGKTMDALIKSAQLPIDVANELLDLQKQQVKPADYAAKLNTLVQQGKVSADTAGQLLAQYTQQYATDSAAEAIGQLAEMAATGQIAADVAKELQGYHKRHVPLKEYEEELQHLVKQGRLTPEQAQRLLSQYKNQLSPEVATELATYQRRSVPLAEYQASLQRLVTAGKISSEQAKELLDEYRQVKMAGRPQGAMLEIIQQAEKATQAGLKQLVASGKISPALGQTLLDLQTNQVPPADYKKQIDALVRQGKITPQDAEGLVQQYEKLFKVREQAGRLNALQNNNVSLDEYTTELKKAVAAGVLLPEEAARLLKEYQEAKGYGAPAPGLSAEVKGNDAFAQLQKRVQATTPTITAPAGNAARDQFSATAAKAQMEASKEELQRIQDLMTAMSSQAGQLINSWQPVAMTGQVGNAEDAAKKAAMTAAPPAGSSAATPATPPIIKAGTILYAVLDTAVNSDFPDSPVLATIVQGDFKGAKLLGKLALTSGQDRVGLAFKLMNRDDWVSGKTINAFAIDPDTARSALASNVNYHYFLRYGGLFASSFLHGYANAVNSSGATITSGIFGTTTTRSNLSPGSKIMTGLGQVGQNLSSVMAGYVTTPPTVKIEPGVSLGILFMQDVS